MEGKITGTCTAHIEIEILVLWTAVIKELNMTGGTPATHTHHMPPLNCLYCNAGSQDNKQEELKFLIYNYKFCLLAIT